MHDSPTHTNRLIHETSPYLLQHAHNPVDWHPWGEEALGRASRSLSSSVSATPHATGATSWNANPLKTRKSQRS